MCLVFVCRILVILGGLDQVVDVNVKIVVVFDVIDGGLGGDLVDHQPGSLYSFVSNIFNLLTHKALGLLARLPVSRQQVLVLWSANGKKEEKKNMMIIYYCSGKKTTYTKKQKTGCLKENT